LLAPHFAARGDEFGMMSAAAYHHAPMRADVLYFAYSGLWAPDFDYRRYVGEIVCTYHDPLEISNFTDRFDWLRAPLRPLPLANFDRISVISSEMQKAFRDYYGHERIYLTPTFPHDAAEIRALARQMRQGTGVTFFSATNAAAFRPLRVVLQRVRAARPYLRDHRGRISLHQMRSILIRKNRKNIPLLERIRSELLSEQRARINFLHSRSVLKPRLDYLRELMESDVYVCTSYMEGGPLPVMEAVLAGLAILSTPVGQVPDWVEHGRNGWLCRTESEFIERARAYLEDAALLRRHQSASLAIAEKKAFDPEPWYSFVLGGASVDAKTHPIASELAS
jgi:glycosyltransferase involved in cell wall biosynthesis